MLYCRDSKNKLDEIHLKKNFLYKNVFAKDFDIPVSKIKMVLIAESYSKKQLGTIRRNGIEFISLNKVFAEIQKKDKDNEIVSEFSLNFLFKFLEEKKNNIRGIDVYLDRDISLLLGITSKDVNKNKNRNKNSFFNDSFSLEKNEYLLILEKKGEKIKKGYLPTVYTKKGVLKLLMTNQSSFSKKIINFIFLNFLNEKVEYNEIVLFFSSLLKIREVNSDQSLVLTLSKILESYSRKDKLLFLENLNELLEKGKNIVEIKNNLPQFIEKHCFY